MVRLLALEPKARSFVCCPKCFCLYDAGSASYTCINLNRPGDEPCGRPLWADGRGNISVPIREYLMQIPGEWLARFYARPGIEALLDRKPSDPKRSSNLMCDIWDAPVLRDFKDHRGRPFFDGPGTESRLVFSLNMDGFNPFMNKQAGKMVSVCGVYLVCLNLPPEIRHRTENVLLVGVIPGPSTPSLHQINHILKPLIDEFLVLWEQGLYLMRTPKHPGGRRVRAAIIPLVCDLPAARQMAGLGGHMFRYFCSECRLQRDDIDELDASKWPRRSLLEHREAALRWQSATTGEEQYKEFQKNGIRWSEMLRLPYWDPTQYVVIDSMHCFYLGLFHRHVREVWGMNAVSPDSDGPTFKTQVPNKEEMARARQVFSEGRNISKLTRHLLVALCREENLRYGGTKAVLEKRLNQVCLCGSMNCFH